MLKSKSNWLKRSLSLMLAVVMLMSMSAVNVFAEGTEQTTQNMTEKYTVPIASLVSAAPLEPVKVAFAKAFGASVVVTVNADGNAADGFQLCYYAFEGSLCSVHYSRRCMVVPHSLFCFLRKDEKGRKINNYFTNDWR